MIWALPLEELGKWSTFVKDTFVEVEKGRGVNNPKEVQFVLVMLRVGNKFRSRY